MYLPVWAQQADQSVEQRKQASFSIWEYQVQGNTLLSDIDIQLVLQPYLGLDKTLKSIGQAADALEVAYAQAGYEAVLVNIPEQDIIAGVVTLVVIEGVVDRVRVTGADYFLLSKIKQHLPSLETQTSPHSPSIEQELVTLNAYTPDLAVTPLVKAGRYEGTMEFDLRVNDKLPLHGGIELSNYYSSNTTKSRFTGKLSYNNLWQAFHSLNLQYVTTPENLDEVSVFAATYVMPIGKHKLSTYIVRSDSEVAVFGSSGSDLTVFGNGSIVGLRYILSMTIEDKSFHTFILGLDYKDVDENVFFADDTKDTIQTPVSYITWTAGYNYIKRHKNSLHRYSVSTNFGLRDIANEVEEFSYKRFRGEPSYVYLQASYNRLQKLPWWELKLNLLVDMQFVESSLVSSEQFSLSGTRRVRGYLESQRIADRGLFYKTELLKNFIFDNGNSLVFSLFAEAARLEVMNPLSEQEAKSNLASIGIGLFWGLKNDLTMQLDFAQVLKNACSNTMCSADNDIKKNESRAMFKMTYDF